WVPACAGTTYPFPRAALWTDASLDCVAGIAHHRPPLHPTRSPGMNSAAAAAPALGATAIEERHPKSLPMLFFTEMWERFSYYGMRALLVLYLVNAIGYQRANALELYATYTALVYLTPIAGGYLADRYLGTRKSILIGALTM